MQYPTTPDTAIKTGDLVRSYDFPGMTEHYMEGVVVGIQNDTYEIFVTLVVVNNQQQLANGFIVRPPVNGLDGIFGKTRGVARIEELTTSS